LQVREEAELLRRKYYRSLKGNSARKETQIEALRNFQAWKFIIT